MPRGPYKKPSEETRHRIWAAVMHPSHPKSLQAVATAEGLSKSTVQGIIDAMKKANAGIALKKRGPPSKMTPAYVFTNQYTVLWTYLVRSWRKRLMILAKKNPFWGGKRLADDIFNSMMATYASMPPGHQFQVTMMPNTFFFTFVFHTGAPKTNLANFSQLKTHFLFMFYHSEAVAGSSSKTGRRCTAA